MISIFKSRLVGQKEVIGSFRFVRDSTRMRIGQSAF